MKIAIYGKHFTSNFGPAIQFLLNNLIAQGVELYIYNPFCKVLFDCITMPKNYSKFWEASDIEDIQPDLLLAIGGDGTVLETVQFVYGTKIPVLGINTGRLGFLSSIAREEISNAVKSIAQGHYSVEERSLIQLKNHDFDGRNVALNEFTVLKKDSASMITVETYIDDEYLNSYWADGLIISTPTGSTAYNLSCGGPILAPTSKSFIITPISPHNLNVRPIVLPDQSTIKLKVKGRGDSYLMALDARNRSCSFSDYLELGKAPHGFMLAKLTSDNFYHTLRNKLMWGLDHRN
jgi:NAD+ kinase